MELRKNEDNFSSLLWELSKEDAIFEDFIDNKGRGILSFLVMEKKVPIQVFGSVCNSPLAERLVNCQDTNMGLTVLHMFGIGSKSTERLNVDYVRLLLKIQGVQRFIQEFDGSTPLHYYVQVDNYEAAEMLLTSAENSQELHLENRNGNTALLLAVHHFCTSSSLSDRMVHLLLQHGSDPNRKSADSHGNPLSALDQLVAETTSTNWYIDFDFGETKTITEFLPE